MSALISPAFGCCLFCASTTFCSRAATVYLVLFMARLVVFNCNFLALNLSMDHFLAHREEQMQILLHLLINMQHPVLADYQTFSDCGIQNIKEFMSLKSELEGKDSLI